MTFKQSLPLVSLITLLLTGGWYWQTQTTISAPDVTFTTIKGETLRLSELTGKPTLITFWATDCPGCIEEIPHLISLHQQFAQRGLTIIAVTMSYDPPNHVLAMTESKQLPYAVVLDPNSTIAQTFGNVQLTPTTFVIDRTGKIAMQKIGVFDLNIMQQRLEALLSTPAPDKTS